MNAYEQLGRKLLGKTPSDHLSDEEMRAAQRGLQVQSLIAYLRTLKQHDLDDELKGMGKKELQEVVTGLGLPIRYYDGSLKPKDVLAAVVFDALRPKPATNQEMDDAPLVKIDRPVEKLRGIAI